jgi:uncharacterized membrane protein YbhN (UPF0104 family)
MAQERPQGASGDPGLDEATNTLTSPKNRPWRRFLAALSLFLTALLIWAIVSYVLRHLQEFKDLWSQPIPKAFLVLLPLSWLLMAVVNSELLRWPLTAYGLKLTFLEGLALTMASTAINYVIPLKSGSGVRGLYLAIGRGLRVSNYLAVLGSVTTMTLTMASFFAFLGLAFLWLQGHRPSPIIPAYFGGTALLGLASVLFLGQVPVKLPGKIKAIAKGWDLIRADSKLFLRLTALQVGYFSAWALFNWLTLAAFGIRLGPFEIVFFCGGQIHATIVNLTPAGLGVVEAFSVYAGKVMEFTPAQALSAQALNRLTAVAMLAIFGLWGWLYLSSSLRRRQASPNPGP